MERVKKLRKKLAVKAGFPLVELIVGIAIRGILPAVAAPTYAGYIARARQSSDLQVLSSVATAIVGVEAGEGVTVDKIEVTRAASGSAASIQISGTDETTGSTITDQSLGTDVENNVLNLLDMTWTELNSSFSADWETATMEDGEWELSGNTPTT